MTQTIYWHDYETFGVNPAIDRPSQFAGIRTNLNLDIVGDPLMLYCQPISDCLPSVDACLITGITPQHAMGEGVPEPEFISKIYQEFAHPQTCGAGYNSLRFDDEVSRYSFYRNFYDPYAREWQNGNSRWDIIDMVRLIYALRPDAMHWPERAPGVPSFKLELLSKANGLEHESAHDALSDVLATIKLAQYIKQKEPRLYDYCWNLRSKHQAASKIDLVSKKPLLHISSKVQASHGCATLIMPLCQHPLNKNAIICVDLCLDTGPLFDLDQQQIKDRLYMPADQAEKHGPRIPLKAIHINRCPVVLPVQMLDAANAERLNIDIKEAELRWQALLAGDGITEKASFAFSGEFEGNSDVDSALYQGFLSNADRRLADSIISASPEQLATQNFLFEDERMTELLFRYRARHFPASLNEQEQAIWSEQVRERFISQNSGQSVNRVLNQSADQGASISPAGSVLDQYEAQLKERLNAEPGDSQRTILLELQAWAAQFRSNFT